MRALVALEKVNNNREGSRLTSSKLYLGLYDKRRLLLPSVVLHSSVVTRIGVTRCGNW